MSLNCIHASFHRRPALSLARQAKAGRMSPAIRRLGCSFSSLAQRRLEERVHTRPRRFGAVRVEPIPFHARGEESAIVIVGGGVSGVELCS